MTSVVLESELGSLFSASAASALALALAQEMLVGNGAVLLGLLLWTRLSASIFARLVLGTFLFLVDLLMAFPEDEKNDVGPGLPSRLVERHCHQHHPVFGIRARELSLLGAFGLCDWRASSGLGGSLHRLWAKVSCRLYHLLYASDLRVLLVCFYW